MINFTIPRSVPKPPPDPHRYNLQFLRTLLKKMAFETDFAKEFENFRKRFLEYEEKSKKDEMRCLMLEIEVENLKKKNQELEGKIEVIQKVIVDSTCMESSNEKLLEVMIENKVLECEKTKAETELSFWKEKAKELESNINSMNEKVKEDMNVVSKGSKQRFPFEEDGCPNKKMALSTPGVAQSTFHGIIDKSQCSSKNNLQNANLEHIDEERIEDFEFRTPHAGSAKRKRRVSISDDENSYDENAPICTLKTQHSSRVRTDSEEQVKENVSRRYLTRLRKLESENKQDKSIDLNKMVGSSEDEEDESESEGGSLSGFIVESSESASSCDPESGDSADESENVLNEYKETLEKIGRKKVMNLKWDLEGDMLSDFGKDPVLCMRAVCALYRQQTADEKTSKETIYQNERGFSHPDAPRASELAEFLTGGDPNGDLNKTVEELKEYNSDGIKQCRALATKYSKQLFTIYQNKEDPYFLPQ
ncbi:hypothetical protein L1987_75981 [Smallanthus sonchifolius]|uniref:Uncharacterized protein n=1 Tax=Smallanthus sonchifolius TaxID=185202 RepID=A0ACB9A732_9ASTR|nr:hypothetical protein L1987_75981 [Smallanthus sonchifolius]